MHRIDTPTAQVDKFGQGKNGFTNGDRTTGRRATELNSDMWDAVQEEIANAIEGAGIELDKSKHNQLYLAIQKAIADKGFVSKNGDRMSGPLGTSYADSYRIVSGQYGTFWRNDSKALYLMLTNAGDPWGTFNNLRPFAVSTNDGSVTIGSGFTVDHTGYINKVGIYPYTSNGQNYNQSNGLHVQGSGDQYADIYYLETVGQYGALSFHIHSGGLDAYPSFKNDGSLALNGTYPVITMSTGTRYHQDGNIWGSIWGGYLSNWLNNNTYGPQRPQPPVQINTDAIGSLAFARLNPQDSRVGYGELVSGSNLSPSGVTGYPGGGNWAALFAEGQLGGTWKCLGLCVSDSEGGNRHYGVSLFVRVS
ncbi:TPA: hypothetical protein ACK1B7_003735 [Serratia marcescens]|uniref:phage tail fiber protein n=1 Tax=Serratia marcescens TaxID=615 RepID=UPI003204F5B9